MGSESHLMGGNQFFLVFWKITLYRLWFIIYVLKFARRKDQMYSDKTTPQETQSEGVLKVQPGKSEWVWLSIKEWIFCSWTVEKDIFPSAPSDKMHAMEQHSRYCQWRLE